MEKNALQYQLLLEQQKNRRLMEELSSNSQNREACGLNCTSYYYVQSRPSA